MSQVATPSSFPHDGEPWLGEEVLTLGSIEFDLMEKKLLQVEVMAAMKKEILSSFFSCESETEREKQGQSYESSKPIAVYKF